MYSSAITKAPVTFFLGAGASRPLGKLLMDEFIDLLKNKPDLQAAPLFNKIVTKERDLEFLLGELEEWKSKFYYYPSYVMLMTDPVVHGPSPFETELHELISSAEAIHEKVRSEVFRQYRSIQNSEAIQPLFLPVFEAAFHLLQPLRQPVVVFTTNYDPAIEDLCAGAADRYDLIDGFFNDTASKSYVWRRDQFDRYQGPESKKNIILFKVHGSTSWTKTPRGIIRSPAPIYTVDDSSHQNVLIYPAKKKVAVEDPFFTAYDYFQRCMEGCKLCITIGYSFRDEDALTRLRSAASLNRDLQVIVLDPRAREICSKKLAPLGIRAEPVEAQFWHGAAFQEHYMDKIREFLSVAVESSK